MPKQYLFSLQRDELDQNLGGGIPEGSLILVEGENGAGKSIICQRFAYGLLSNEKSVTFISTQLTTRGFINQMYSLNYPISTYLLNKSLLFLPVVPLLKASRSRLDFIDRLISSEVLYETDVLVIDTISAMIKYSVDSEKSLELLDFFKKVAAGGKIIILSVDNGSLDNEVMSVFKTVCDIYFELKSKVMMGDIKRSIYVNKFIGAPGQVRGIVGFRVEPKVGLVVDISSVS